MNFVFSLLLSSITFSVFSYSQLISLNGKVVNAETNEPLVYANIRVLNVNAGTSTNKEGNFQLKLREGKYDIVASYMGFISDTISGNIHTRMKNIVFKLIPSTINLAEVLVLPEENPANEIIRNAIKRRIFRESLINDYQFNVSTKGVIRSEQDLNLSSNSVSVGSSSSDTAELKITAILENKSIGFFKKPDTYKEIIIARKQTANFPAAINTLTGGRIIQNFNTTDLRFFNRRMIGPLSDNSLNYYSFQLIDTASIDNQNVYKIFMTPIDSNSPGFFGDVYFNPNSFDLLKVDLMINKAANLGGFFDTVQIYQQFFPFQQNIYMPVDYHLLIKANFLGLAKFGFELNSSMSEYSINNGLTDEFFDNAILTVTTEADKRDSTYWDMTQRISNTQEELEAYSRIDSVNKIPRTFWDRYSILGSQTKLNDNLSITTPPIGIYHFNRVEGNRLNFGFFWENLFEDRFSSSLGNYYGFSDKKFKYNLKTNFLLGDLRTWQIKFSVYDKLKTQFEENYKYGDFFTTLNSLISKNEFSNYYYSKGWNIYFSGELFPILFVRGGFTNRTDKSANTNSDFSLLNRNKIFPTNQQIYNVRSNIVNIGFRLDFRKYIEDGKFRRRLSMGNSSIIIDADVYHTDKNLFNSQTEFTSYSLKLFGNLYTFGNSFLQYSIKGIYGNGPIPYQMLNVLEGNINLIARNNTFRTLEYNEIMGDRGVIINLEHNFGDQIFRWLEFPILKNLQLNLNYFLNIAISKLSEESRKILVNPAKVFNHPFYETGFSIGHPLIPIQLSFAWKLNYKGENNFRIGFTTLIIEEL